MKRVDRKSDCAINYALEAIADPWSMLIVRDIVYYGKKTFGEFMASDEHIASSALSRRLTDLEQKGILVKSQSSDDRRKEVYDLTEKGLDLIPILLDLADWGAQHDPQTKASTEWINFVRSDKQRAADLVRDLVREGGSVIDGNGSIFPFNRE